jgi:hypothetical protein
MLLTDTLPSCRDPISQQVRADVVTMTRRYRAIIPCNSCACPACECSLACACVLSGCHR